MKSQLFLEALNSVFVVYCDSPEVLLALKDFHDAVLSRKGEDDLSSIHQKLLELFKAMCKDLKISTEALTDSFFLVPFNYKLKKIRED